METIWILQEKEFHDSMQKMYSFEVNADHWG